MDTDEFWRGDDADLGAHLDARASAASAQEDATVLELCRGQLHPNGSWAALAAPKYAMRPADCREDALAFAWVHYGFCGRGSLPVQSHFFDEAKLLERCGGQAASAGYLDHSFRYCLMGEARHDALCSPLRCYPNVSYNGECGRAPRFKPSHALSRKM